MLDEFLHAHTIVNSSTRTEIDGSFMVPPYPRGDVDVLSILCPHNDMRAQGSNKTIVNSLHVYFVFSSQHICFPTVSAVKLNCLVLLAIESDVTDMLQHLQFFF